MMLYVNMLLIVIPKDNNRFVVAIITKIIQTKNCVFAMYFGCHESRVSQFRGDFRKEISTMVKWEGNHRGGI